MDMNHRSAAIPWIKARSSGGLFDYLTNMWTRMTKTSSDKPGTEAECTHSEFLARAEVSPQNVSDMDKRRIVINSVARFCSNGKQNGTNKNEKPSNVWPVIPSSLS